ncbi:MerR family transcriptional regulator [Aerococcus loyolae]|uniref:MerR family transcriptional regulator n=1 Tax=Aerococcus urinae TaxID=1376 RepID=A0A2I1L6R2_9LACT|nr:MULTISPECIES: MerR family transcriptional regulator [Aerococcus]MCY3067848.1 MerR family transcriptional regulator [Aerococcus mictus]MCY3080661.1 MerR family transcriptional regulator [Aerococcus mictus]MDK6727925.1 MerR family transcriptional regulator [Aerococcus urinae]MDK7910206.1 MerR family transcriptional regulator [Aerococcus urinae]MDK8610058.1 MerR family transcriptional regulator [Aerococcus urinae]
MAEKQLRRSRAVFPIGTVMKLTDLTARQIRYYEEQKLIAPHRTDTNRRMYSLNDVDRLLDIKDYLDDGYSIQMIYKIYNEPKDVLHESKQLTEDDVRRILYNEFLAAGGFDNVPGEKPRF